MFFYRLIEGEESRKQITFNYDQHRRPARPSSRPLPGTAHWIASKRFWPHTPKSRAPTFIRRRFSAMKLPCAATSRSIRATRQRRQALTAGMRSATCVCPSISGSIGREPTASCESRALRGRGNLLKRTVMRTKRERTCYEDRRSHS
jgi:hypothetical protein